MKILSPAGNLESLKMAVYNGADEVYLGINDFNARNNIDGFTLATLKEAVDFAHVFGVKVLLAINILFADNEMQNAIDTIIDAYNIGIDAFIIQDIGLAQIVHANYPEIELHASTQMGLHNLEGVKAIEKFGFKRVVLARETPLSEVKRIKENTSIEIEYFCQGALCVAFSGNCYLSSYMHGASGNRGKCKQLCRLPYTLEKDGKTIKSGYLLSAKDFNMINRLDELKNAGIDVLKIEGRARRPEYVGLATREYYNALHGSKHNPDNLKLAFNREYTAGYLDGNENIISDYNNHIGLYIGKVEKVNNGKNFNEIIISSNRPLYPKSTFKFFSGKSEKNTLTAYDIKEISKNKYRITTTQKLNEGLNVNLILDSNLENEIIKTRLKKDILIKIYAKENTPIKATTIINGQKIEITGDTCEKAIKQPLSESDLESNFSKSEIFNAKLDIVNLDSIFLPKQKLNDFRRKVFDAIHENIVLQKQHNLKKIKINKNYIVKKFNDFEIVDNINNKFNSQNIVYSPEIYSLDDITKFVQKCKKTGKTPYLDTPNFALEKDIKLLQDIIEKTDIGIVANNYYSLDLTPNTIIGAGLNVYNSFTAKIYDLPIITAESNIATRLDYPYMTLRHCPIKSHLNCDCKTCKYSPNITYRMENGKTLKLKRKKLSTCTFYLTN